MKKLRNNPDPDAQRRISQIFSETRDESPQKNLCNATNTILDWVKWENLAMRGTPEEQ